VPKLSVTVITKNEAADLADALASVAWADEIVVVDSQSTDDTVAIARRFTDRVVARAWPGYIAQKNYAAAMATHDWILSLDADERVTPALATEIQARLATAPQEAAFRIPRVTWHLGRWIRSTDWYPDYQLRLYDRRAAEWTGRYVHEAVTVRGAVGDLGGELQHYAYRDIADHLETIDRYTTLAARQMHESTAGVPAQLRRERRLSGRRSRIRHLEDERVLRVPEIREAMGAGAAQVTEPRRHENCEAHEEDMPALCGRTLRRTRRRYCPLRVLSSLFVSSWFRPA
jgi:glycosyltransferase involved in cell wall biosynthesis